MGSQRRDLLHKVFEDSIKVNGGRITLDVSPGPGEYDIESTRVVRGGALSTAGAYPSALSSTHQSPGPGDYEAYSPSRSGCGVIPFTGRGKIIKSRFNKFLYFFIPYFLCIFYSQATLTSIF